MALFQFRRSRDEQAAKLGSVPTVEAMRRRAMHRLIGAAVLVLAGVIGFPLVFDNQPRPIPVDLPIEIADKSKVKPLVPPPVVAPAVAASPITTASVAAPATTNTSANVAASTPPPPAIPATVSAKPPAAAASKSSGSVTEPPASKTADATKAQALLEGKAVAGNTPPAEGRFVVQVGAFAEQEKVREVRLRVEKSGLKTYTQVVDTKDGGRTRVRVGPFADREQAQKVVEKIRKLDLSPVILAL